MNVTTSNVNTVFTPDQKLYLRFIAPSIKKKIRDKVSPIFIAANEKQQRKFLQFVKTYYYEYLVSDANLTNPNYSIRKTLAAIYNIIKKDVEDNLGSSELKDEKECQSDAYRDAIKQGQLGKVFTSRQAYTLILNANKITIPLFIDDETAQSAVHSDPNIYHQIMYWMIINPDTKQLAYNDKFIEKKSREHLVCITPKEHNIFAELNIDKFITDNPDVDLDRDELKAILTENSEKSIKK